MKSCTIIYNPNSGHAKEIVNHLEPTDLVISMGGDGTFNEVMSGNLERKKPLILAHIPVGTTNDVGVMFGYGKDIKKNLKLLLDGTIKGMDICVINGRPFVYVAGFGKFMQIPYNTPRKLKKKYGYMAYLLEGVKDFFNPTKMYDITYKVNGIEKRGLYSFMLISNANRIAGINNFYKDVKLDDDQFEVLFCNFKRRVDIIKTFTILMTTDIERVSGVEFYKTNHLEIKFADYPKKAWCIDGEKLDRAVLNYEISNVRNVKIMMPKKNIDKIFVNKKV